MKPIPRFRTSVLLLLATLIVATACEKDNDTPADQFVTWSMSGNNGILSAPPDSLSAYYWSNENAIYGMSQSGDAYFELTFSGPQSPGNYTANSFLVRANGNFWVPSANPVQVSVTTYGAGAGQYLIGTYSGTIKDSATSSNLAVSGTFRLKNQ